MSYARVLRDGRRKRREAMRSTCRIVRPSDAHVFDPETGQYEDDEPTLIYEGPCHFKAWSGIGQRAESAGRDLVSSLYDVALPYDDAPAVSVSDTLYLTSSDLEWAVGIRYPVYSVEQSDDRTAFHITVRDLDRGTVDHA